MNTLFEKLLAESHLSEKDKHTIKQVFYLLPSEKQQRLMSNFRTLCHNIDCINTDIAIEQKILFEDLITDLDEILKNSKNRAIQSQAQSEILGLKGEL
jgi:hypothetical protein